MIQISKKAFEEKKEAWTIIAKRHNWYKSPFYICIWVDEKGKIMEALTTTKILETATKNIIKDWKNDEVIPTNKYEFI